MLKLLIAAIVFAHGVGHILFLIPTLRIAAWAEQSGASWALSHTVGDGASRAFGGVLWGSTMVLFVAAVGGFLSSTDWWPGAAIAGALVSLTGIVLMWGGIAPKSAFFALLFDLVVLTALLWARWPTSGLAGN